MSAFIYAQISISSKLRGVDVIPKTNVVVGQKSGMIEILTNLRNREIVHTFLDIFSPLRNPTGHLVG